MAVDGSQSDDTRSFVNLAAGTTVSHYTIISKIGAGGMGEVYLAEDTQLDRKVALKFLPLHLSQDEAARSRFTREAKASAKLDHPNIVQVFEVGEFQGRPFFAMAHIEGKSLREIINEGKLSASEAIEFTKQICEGLYKAHESGVVHRDIKPGNIIIDEDNKVRIVDFGLATVTGEDKLTKTGSTLGTAGYMSPEQIEGKKVDQRSDIFSVGVILYEMLTGRRPFEGDTDAAVGRAITDSTPEPIARYKSGTTGQLQQVVDKALMKDPALRYQHADGMLADLRRLELGLPVARKSRRRMYVILTTLLSLAFITSIYRWIDSGQHHNIQSLAKKQLTFTGNIFRAEISPDGQYVAYVTGQYYKTTGHDSMYVFVRDLDGGEPVKIFQEWWISQISWSPDSRDLLIRGDNLSGGGFYVLPRFGGTPRPYPLPQYSAFWHMTWSPDGTKFAAAYDMKPKDIYIIDRQSGKIERYVAEGAYDWIYFISWSPLTDQLLVTTRGGEEWWLWTMNPETGEFIERVPAYGTVARWSSDGRSIVFQTSKEGGLISLNQIMVDPETLEAKGEAAVIVADLQAYNKISISGDLRRAVFANNIQWSNLWLATRMSESDNFEDNIQHLTHGTAAITSPEFSPDGSSLTFAKSMGGRSNIFRLNLEDLTQEQMTHGDHDQACVWSPDGTQLAYLSSSGSGKKLTIKDVGGSAPLVFDSCIGTGVSTESAICWAPGDKIILRPPGDRRLMAVDPKTGESEMISPDKDLGYFYFPVYSPDRKKIAVMWFRTDTPGDSGEDGVSMRGIWEFSLGDTTRRLVHYAEVVQLPLGWSKNMEWLYVWAAYDKYLIRISDSGSKVTDTVAYLPDAYIVRLSPDNRKLVYRTSERSRDAWLVENISVP